MIQFDPHLENVACVHANRIVDERGVLTKVVADGRFTIPGFVAAPKQVVHSGTAKMGTLRGLHAQAPPFTEAKVIVSVTGRMYWVAVDLRKGSSTFGRWQGYELSPDGTNALSVPAGFGHGCLSLTNDVNLLIMADKDFSPEHGIGIAWNDPEIAVDWPLSGAKFLVSAAHAAFGPFAVFRKQYGGL